MHTCCNFGQEHIGFDGGGERFKDILENRYGVMAKREKLIWSHEFEKDAQRNFEPDAPIISPRALFWSLFCHCQLVCNICVNMCICNLYGTFFLGVTFIFSFGVAFKT